TLSRLCLVLRPRRDRSFRPLRRNGTAPGLAKPRTRRNANLSGLNVRLQRSLSSLRSSDCSETTPDSLPTAGHALSDGIRHPQGSCERFPQYPPLHRFLLSQASRDAMPGSASERLLVSFHRSRSHPAETYFPREM